LAIDFVDFQDYYGDVKKDKKITDDDLITKKYLNKVLDEKIEITKSDLKKYVDDKFVNNASKIIGYVEMRFKSVDEKLKKVDKKLEILDSILKTLDWLAKDYRDLKDEQTVQSEQIRRLDDRTTVLEKRVFTS